MPYKNKNKNREYNKQLLRKKRNDIYKKRDELSVVVHQIKNKDGTNSPFTFTPIILTAKDKNTLNKIITGQFI